MTRRLAAALLLLLATPGAAAAPGPPRMLVHGSVRVVYWPGDEGIAKRTLNSALAPLLLPGIGTRQGVRAGTILLAPDPAAFDSLTGGEAPEWSAGVAIPERATIVLPAYNSRRTAEQDPITALRHELVHIALHEYLGVEVPRWFDEGYATWAAGGWDASAAWQIRLALLRGLAPPLDSLSLRWPAAAPQARIAYLLSASAVQFLADRGGDAAFAAFLASWRRQGSIDRALRETYLLSPERFEREWRGMVVRRYGWLLALAQVGFFWVLITLLFLAVGFRRRRRDRHRLEVMEEEERLAPPYVEPDDLDEDSPAPGEAAEEEADGGVDDEWRRR
jgi:hypothetical protein